MADLQKVIIGLEHHRRCQCSFGKDDICPYWCEENDSASLCSDALELLKTLQPRVLTRDEVQNNCPDCVYIETNTGWLECTIMDSGESNRYFCVLVYGRDEFFIKTWVGYGKVWRCWSARPTDEQRKAVAWDG